LGTSGLTLDACLEFAGIPQRPDPKRSSVPHDALEDAKYTTEVIARVLTGQSYLKEFEKHKVGELLTPEYRKYALSKKIEK